MPQQIVSEIRRVHGGLPADYRITQATISPFLITCRNAQTRDAIVQSGLYNISSTRAQFTVHEWRPRFGMGYNPTTYQVWIRIYGLPLQAWNTREITAFLRTIGHPQLILPFGPHAGHYRHITALIDTMHPSRIPLACMYREGDYATQIDILLLTWRQWQQDDFPPPDDNFAQDDHHGHTQQYDGNATPLTRSSSSSSSNNAPSEPTIDYSCWSPRSYQLNSYQQRIWLPKHQTKQTSLLVFPSYNQDLLSAASNLPTVKILKDPKRTVPFATEDLLQNSWLIRLLTQIHPLSLCCPILINPPSPHCDSTPGDRTWMVSQEKPPTTCPFTTPLPLTPTQRTETLALTLANVSISPAVMIFTALCKISFLSPLGPLVRNLPKLFNSLSHRPEPSSLSHKAEPTLFEQAQQLTHSSLKQFTGLSTPLLPWFSEDDGDAPLTLHTCPPLRTSISALQATSSLLAPTTIFDSTTPNSSEAPLLLSPHTTQEVVSVNHSLSPSKKYTDQDKVKKKSDHKPIRRSQRIRDRHNMSSLMPKNPAGRNSKTKKPAIPFEASPTLTPLDTNKALAILQATGLQIDKQVEKMIEEALKRDKDSGEIGSSQPSTPLHDPVPPMSVPQFELPL